MKRVGRMDAHPDLITNKTDELFDLLARYSSEQRVGKK